jgi:hypothetical protein
MTSSHTAPQNTYSLNKNLLSAGERMFRVKKKQKLLKLLFVEYTC